MAVFDGVCYSLSPSLAPSRRSELASVLDLNGAVPRPPFTHIIAPVASHAHTDAISDAAIKLVSDRWVDRSIIMGKLQPEQYYSPDPAMIFSAVIACATDLSAADLEVLSAGITALGGQWRAGLTRDVTHLFALRAGSDKYNTALHYAPQTHMCILTPHWFDDAVRLGRRIPEMPYTWPDPLVLRPGITLNLDDDTAATEGRRRRKPAVDPDAEATDTTNVPDQGERIRVWAGRRILLSASLELTDGSRRAIEARIQRAGGTVVRASEDEDEHAEEKAVDGSDVLVTRWRSGKAYFKAARTSLLVGSLSWLFSVESSGTLHSPLDSLLWYPTPRGGIPGLIDCEISITNYTGAARDYLKRLITLVGAKFTPSMSQSNKVLIAGFQPSPKTTRALSWSIPIVNHTWLEDCFVEWRSLTVGLERYIVYPPGVDFGKILLSQHNGAPSSQSLAAQRAGGGAVPGGRGIGSIDLEQEETRDAEYRTYAQEGGPAIGLSMSHEAAATADGASTALSDGDLLPESRIRPRSCAGSLKKTPSSALVKRGSMSTPVKASSTGAFVDHVIELPVDEDDVGSKQRTPTHSKHRQQTASLGPRGMPRSVTRQSSVGLFSPVGGVEVVVPAPEGSPKGRNEKEKEKGKGKGSIGSRETRSVIDAEADEDRPPKPSSRPAQRRPAVRTALTDDETENRAGEPPRRRIAKRMTIGSDLDSEGEGSVPPRRPAATGSMTPVKSGMKPRPRSKSQSRPRSVMGRESEDEMRVLAAESWITKDASKRRQDPVKHAIHKEAATKENETEKRNKERKDETKKVVPRPRTPTRSPSPTSPIVKNPCLPKRGLSVLVPSVPKEYFSSSQSLREAKEDNNREGETGEKDSAVGGTSAKRKRLVPAASMLAIAAEVSTSTTKRGRPSPTKISIPVIVSGKSKPQAPPKDKPKSDGLRKTIKLREDEEKVTSETEENDSSVNIDSPVVSTSRGRPRRSAANRAATRLRNEIMPSMVNFEKEQKQAKRRRSAGGESVASGMDGEIEERGGKKRKVTEKVEEEEEEAEVEDVVLVPSVQAKLVKKRGRPSMTAAVVSDDTSNSVVKSKPSEPQQKNGDRGRGMELAPVRLITTCVTLSDDVIKRLTKLGVQMTTKPMDCTHLVAKGIVRTEKFLCALPVSPWILTEEWANASAKVGELLPEKDYLLTDGAAEERWAFNLVDAMARARGPEGGSNLFKQMTFYLTPKVSVDAKLFKNVVSAGGGQVQTSTTPTLRILRGKAHRYVISCSEDKAVWRPLAQEGFKIYSPELVLRGALRQEIEWENEECLAVVS